MKKSTKRIVIIFLALTLILQMVLNVTVFAEGNQTLDLTPYLTDASIKAEINGNWYDVENLPAGMKVPRGSKIEVKLSYSPRAQEEGEDDPIFKPGDKLVYTLPEQIVADSNQSGKVVDGPTTVGEYVITTDGKIVITLTNEQYLEDTAGLLKNGNISFSGHLDSDSWGNSNKGEIDFGELTVTVPLEEIVVQEKGNVTIDKSSQGGLKQDSQGRFYIDYMIVVKAPADNTKVMENIRVADSFTAGSEYVQGVLSYNAPQGTTFDPATRGWTIGTMQPGQTYTLKYRVFFKDSIDDAGTDTQRKLTNEAAVYTQNTQLNKDSVTTTLNAGLNISKNNGGYDRDSGTVTYTVKVTAPANNSWTLNNVSVKDVFGENKSYVLGYTSVTPSKGTITNTASANTDKTLIWQIGSLAPNESVTLTYTVDVDEKIFYAGTASSIDRTLKNTATAMIDSKAQTNANSNVSFKKVWIWKNGTLQSDGRILFVIHANESTNGGPVLNGTFTFDDSLEGSDWVYDGEVVVKWYAQGPTDKGAVIGQTSFNVDGKTEWEWTHQGGYYYEFEYYARLKENVIGKPSISNDVSVGVIPNDDPTAQYNHNTSWSGTGKEYDALKKQFVSLNGNIATWRSQIICPVVAGAVYSDWRNGDHMWTFTDEQIAAIQVTGAGAGKNYTITRTGTSGNAFTITFNEAIEASEQNPIIITYDSTLKVDDLKEAETAKYVNRAKLTMNGHEDTAQAECYYTREQRLLKTAGSYNPDNAQMTWNIQVNVTGSLNGAAVLEDILPNGVEFVEAKITNRGSKANGTQIVNQEVVGNTVILMLDGLVASNDKNASVTVQVTTRVVDPAFLTGNVQMTFTNRAILRYNGENNESTAQQTIKNQSLEKKGVYDRNTAPDIVYTIIVNPHGLDLLKSASTINITDTMGENLMLKRDTLVIKNSKTGAVIQPQNLTVNGRTFSFDVPDDQPLIITYNAYVMGEVGERVTVTNTVSFTGFEESSQDDAQNSVYILESNATVEGVTAFYISKTDDAFATPLEGAEYTLYYVNADGSVGDVVMTRTADKNGHVSFVDIDEFRVYAFRETKTVDGYYIDEINANYTFVAFNRDSITEGMADRNISIIQRGTVFERTNKRGEIVVEKNFVGECADGVYYFALYNENGELVMLNDGKTAAVAGCTVNGGAVISQAKFRGVPFGTYRVFESDASGNKLDVDEDGVIVVYATRYVTEGDGSRVTITEANATAQVPITNTFLSPSVTLGGTKSFLNEELAGEMEFTFQLLQGEEVIDEVTIPGSGSFFFGKLDFSREDIGTHTYTVRELIPEEADPNMVYDTTEYEITIEIVQRDEDGLVADVYVDGEYIREENGVCMLPQHSVEDKTQASFVNIFVAPTGVSLGATKLFINEEKTEPRDFTFELLQDDEVIEQVTITGSGEVIFSEMTYGLADVGLHTYTVREVIPPLAGSRFIYDESEYVVTVEVLRDGESALTTVVSVDEVALEQNEEGVYMLPTKIVDERYEATFINMFVERVPGTGDNVRYAHYVLTFVTFLLMVLVVTRKQTA